MAIVLLILKWLCMLVGAVILIIGLALVIFWKKVKTFFKMMISNGRQPVRISLIPIEAEDSWEKPKIMRQYMQDLEKEGFTHAGNFYIPELAGLKIAGYVKPDEALIANVYDHTLIKPSFDLGAEYEDESTIEGANTDLGSTLEVREGRERIDIDGGSVAEVLAAVREKHPNRKTPLPVSVERYVQDFERDFFRASIWRLAKGGVSFEEFRTTAGKQGEKRSEENLRETYEEMREGYLEDIQEACIDLYMDQQELDAYAMEELELFALPYAIKPGELLTVLEDFVYLTAETQCYLREASKAPDMESAIRILEEKAFPPHGITRAAELTGPLPAVIFQVPEEAPMPV